MFCCRSIYFISIHETHLLKLADPGSIVQTGYSAGSRSLPCFDWVRNILSKRLSNDAIDALDRETAHVFALFWMLIRRRLPSSVSDDLVDWMAETGIQRMNKDILRSFQDPEENNFGEIELDIGDDLFSFQWAEFAPPSGVMAANYSRYFESIFSIFYFSYYCIDMFTGKQDKLINIPSHGQWNVHWKMIKAGTFTTVTMEFASKEVATQLWHGILHISMERAYKTIHPLHKPFPISTRLAWPS